MHPNTDHKPPVKTQPYGTVPFDQDGEIVYVPQAQVTANLRANKDGESYYFRLNGGPYHGKTIRVYPPFTVIIFREPRLVYEIHPPLDKSGEWVYTFNPELNVDDYKKADPPQDYKKWLHDMEIHALYKAEDNQRTATIQASKEIRFVDETNGEDDGTN